MNKKLESIGIVDVFCDFDEYDSEYRKAFMQFEITENYELKNKFLFLDDETVYSEETFESSNIFFKQIGIHSNKVKIQFGGEIILLNANQLKRLEQIITKYEEHIEYGNIR